MKKILISLVALATFAGASAQADIFDNPDNKAYIGARLGLDISSAAGNSKMFSDFYNNGAGFTLGAVYNIPVYKNLYVEPGLSMFYNTFGQDLFVDNTNKKIDSSIRNFGFRVPMLVGYHFDFTDDVRVAPFTGPQLNLSVLAREHVDSDSYDDHSIFGEYGFKHVDLQWVFGVGVSYERYYLSVSGGVGMTRCMSIGGNHFRRNTFNISIGYNFN